jgi:DHA1 family bicyclomycin/chloramphenicol resistance-like MFS transporter
VAALGLVIFTMPKLRQQQEAAAADQMPAAA